MKKHKKYWKYSPRGREAGRGRGRPRFATWTPEPAPNSVWSWGWPPYFTTMVLRSIK